MVNLIFSRDEVQDMGFGWVDGVDDFARSHMGWLSPDGTLTACSLHRHFEKLGEILPDRSDIDQILRMFDEARHQEAACEENLKKGEHPEWHYYEIAKSDAEEAKFAYIDSLYAEGWVRLGIHGANTLIKLEAESTEESLSLNRKILENLCVAVGATLEPRPREVQGGSSLKM